MASNRNIWDLLNNVTSQQSSQNVGKSDDRADSLPGYVTCKNVVSLKTYSIDFRPTHQRQHLSTSTHQASRLAGKSSVLLNGLISDHTPPPNPQTRAREGRKVPHSDFSQPVGAGVVVYPIDVNQHQSAGQYRSRSYSS